MSQNLLGLETSPYLQQHRDNPVHWRPWGAAALAEAKAENRPIMLSIGYAACHWCHVMAHESFENPETAALMNELFIPIKVDREERPDIDVIYQQALSLTGQQGGWPLTMFLTPAGEPFWGGTYFPPSSRWGRPGFPDVLRSLATAYHGDKAKIAANSQSLKAGLVNFSAPQAPLDPDALTPELLNGILTRLVRAVDPVHGGIGSAPKFPQCSILELLWRGYRRFGDAGARDAVLLTLERMSQGGIYDHVGGGYARYSTDDIWLAPHFEKMLYDNAQLIDLLSWAWAETGIQLFADRVAETIDWLLREMRQPGGAFAATLDADSEHEEGKFYVWSDTEIDAALGIDAALFKAIYDVTPGGNWEGKTILNRSNSAGASDAATEATLEQCRTTLLKLRATRVRPGLDDKILSDWNGLMIAALARAGDVFDRADWVDAARGAWSFVTTTMCDDEGRLVHSWCRGQTHPGTLDDHAAMSLAGIALAQVTNDGAFLDRTRQWVGILDRYFSDADRGGYFLTATDTPGLIVRPRTVSDQATPSGNGMMVSVLAELWLRTGDQEYRVAAERQVDAFSGELGRNAFSLAAFLNGVDLLQDGTQLVVIMAEHEPESSPLLHEVRSLSFPGLVRTVLKTGDILPEQHPAFGKGTVNGSSAVYICRGTNCSPPITSARDIRAALVQNGELA